jgi:hypothetical protein
LIVIVLLGVWFVLCAGNAVQHFVILSTGTAEKVWVLDVDFEASFYTWFSVLMLGFAAVISFGLAAYKGDLSRPRSKEWTAIGLILLVMSVDEMLSFHEHLSHLVRSVMSTSGIFTFSWVIPALFVVGLITILLWSLLRSLPVNVGLGIIASGVVFLTGAVGMEMVAGQIISESESRILAFESAPYRVVSSVEEALEGLGVIILIRTLLVQAQLYVPSLFAAPVAAMRAQATHAVFTKG